MSRNLCGFRDETVAAEYETDAALVEWGDVTKFPPPGHYFHSAFRAECALREEDFEWIKNSKAASSSSDTSTGSGSS